MSERQRQLRDELAKSKSSAHSEQGSSLISGLGGNAVGISSVTRGAASWRAIDDQRRADEKRAAEVQQLAKEKKAADDRRIAEDRRRAAEEQRQAEFQRAAKKKDAATRRAAAERQFAEEKQAAEERLRTILEEEKRFKESHSKESEDEELLALAGLDYKPLVDYLIKNFCGSEVKVVLMPCVGTLPLTYANSSSKLIVATQNLLIEFLGTVGIVEDSLRSMQIVELLMDLARLYEDLSSDHFDHLLTNFRDVRDSLAALQDQTVVTGSTQLNVAVMCCGHLRQMLREANERCRQDQLLMIQLTENQKKLLAIHVCFDPQVVIQNISNAIDLVLPAPRTASVSFVTSSPLDSPTPSGEIEDNDLGATSDRTDQERVQPELRQESCLEVFSKLVDDCPNALNLQDMLEFWSMFCSQSPDVFIPRDVLSTHSKLIIQSDIIKDDQIVEAMGGPSPRTSRVIAEM